MKMMNFNILGKLIEEEKGELKQLGSGIFLPAEADLKNYKEVIVEESYDEEELPKGSKICVPKHVGLPYKEFVIVNKRDVIMFE